MSKNPPQLPKQVASSFVNLESYIRDSHLVISTPPGKTFIGRTYEMSPLTGGGIEFGSLVKSMFKMASDDSMIQVVSVTYPDYDAPYVLAKGKIHGNGLVTELVQRQAKLLEEALEVDRLLGVPTINHKTVFISLMTPVKAITQAVVEEAIDTQNEFFTGLKNNGFHDVKILKPGSLLSAYNLMAKPYERRIDVELDEVLELSKQVFGPDDVFDPRPDDYALMNGVYMGAVVPKKLPRSPNHGLMNLLIGAPLIGGSTSEGGGVRPKTPFILSATVRVANQRREASRIAKALKSREHNTKLPFSLGVEDTPAVARDLDYMQKTCSDGSNKYVFASMCAFVFGKTKSEMNESRTYIKQTMDNLKFDARIVKDGTTLPRFSQVLPLNFHPKIADKLDNEALMPASSAARILPIFGDYLGNADLQSSNTGMCLITERGQAYWFDPFRTQSNKNGSLSAKSGAGKSFMAQALISCSMAEGTKVIYFDNGRSAKKFCKGTGGDYVEFRSDDPEKPSLNPFSNLQNDKEFDEQQETITALMLKMAYFNEDMQPGARIAVSESVKAAWGSKKHKATLQTVLQSLEGIKANSSNDKDKSEVVIAATNLIPRLKNFLDAPARGAFFTGRSTLDPKKLLTVYEMAGLDGDEHLKQCVLFFVMNQLMMVIKNMPGRKLIILDEAWQLLKDPGAAAIMEGMYRKARKDGGSIWVITQSPRDLKGNPTGEVILSQSVWKLVMEQEPEEVDKIINEGVITKYAGDAFFHRTIKDVKSEKGLYSGVLIIGEDTYERCRLYVDRFTAAMFATESDERDAVFQMMEHGVDPVDAIDQLIGDTSRKRKRWLKEIVQQLRNSDQLSDHDIKRELEEVMSE